MCWTHVRRRFYEIAAAGPVPRAEEALHRIARLYEIEADIRGRDAGARKVARQCLSRPVIVAFETWLRSQLVAVSGKSPAAEAIRPLALTRKNALFAGSDAGAQHWACLASLIETCKLNGVDPLAYLSDILSRLAQGHPVNRLVELLP